MNPTDDELAPQDIPPPPPAPEPAVASTPEASVPPPRRPMTKTESLADRVRSDARADSAQLRDLASENGFMNFLNFRTLIFPTIVKYLYVIATLIVVFIALAMIGKGVFGESAPAQQLQLGDVSFQIGSRSGVGLTLTGLLWLVLGPVAVRIQFECIMLLFRMLEELQNLNKKMK